MTDRYTEQQKATDDRWLQLMGDFQRIDDKWLDMIDDEMSHLPSSPYFTDDGKSQ